MNKRHLTAALGSLALAVAAPAAQAAGQHPDNRAVNRATSPALTQGVSPDDRAVDRATRPIPTVPARIEVIREPSGFDWSDAAIGAGAATGLGLVAFGGLLGMSSRRRRIAEALA